MSERAARQQAPAPSQTKTGGAVLQRACACGKHTGEGECDECRKARLQRAARGAASAAVAPPAVYNVLRAPGQPLDAPTRALMEPRFAHDFSRVRMHTDAQAAESARAVNAHAYTVGQHIVFDAGRYAPQTRAGQQLLAHELAHTVQQRGGPQTFQARLAVGPTDDAHEREAERAAAAVMGGGSAGVAAWSGPALQRVTDEELAARAAARDAGAVADAPPSSASSEDGTTAQTGAPSEGFVDQPGGAPEMQVERVVLSCEAQRVAFFTSVGTYVYHLAPDCAVPVGSYDASVAVNEAGSEVTWSLGTHAGTGFLTQAHFRYRIRPGQPNPATFFRNQTQVPVESVVGNEGLPSPQSQGGPSCLLSFDDRIILEGREFDEALFETLDFNETLWSHEIPLGQLGWFEASAYARGTAEGRLSGSYGPGTLHSVCLWRSEGGNRLGGRARFTLPAQIGAAIDLRGAVGLQGEWLSFINIAHGEAQLDAHGEVTGDAELDAEVNVSYDRARRKWRLDGDAALSVRGGLGFGTDLSIFVLVAGFEVWRQRWKLVDAQIGATWQGGLRVSSTGGVSFQPGGLEIGATSSPSAVGTAGVSSRGGAAGSGGTPSAPSGFSAGALVSAVLSEAHVTPGPDGGNAGGICRPPTFLAPGSPPATVDGELTRQALKERVKSTDLSLDSFRRNFAIAKAMVNGQTVYVTAFNNPGELHSETLLVGQLQSQDPRLLNTRVLQIYTERQPCPACATDIDGIRRTLGDVAVFYTVAQRVAPRLRARRLMGAYCLRPPAPTGDEGSEEGE